ncbi:MAG: sugar transporter ATP-binding protein [Marmoricola sp.]|nr:sugar transporter ATP-binding protein [Marmoricola sp.]MCW2838206.1 sugar transporter ATP-binding protein [Marmoricola sp.]
MTPVPESQPRSGLAESALRLEARGIRKSFGGVEVLKGVDFRLEKGKVHGLVGQNGAGKSTLMKILNGVYTRDGGEILVDGQVVDYSTPNEAQAAGIGMVFQELSLINSMTVAQNVLLTREPRGRVLLSDRQAVEQTKAIFAEIGVDIDPRADTARLSVGSRQLVEIAKALSQKPRILVLDEPTASLTSSEVETLFAAIRRLTARGISVVYISHRMPELFEICQQITVLRDGAVTKSADADTLTIDQIVAEMLGPTLGRELEELQNDQSAPVAREHVGEPLLRVTGLTRRGIFEDVTFDLWPGEIVGIAGLLGSGRSEIMRGLFGIDKLDSGTVDLAGERLSLTSPKKALDAGLGFVPEDRRVAGLVLKDSVFSNLMMASWPRVTRWGWVGRRSAEKRSKELVDRLKVKTAGLRQQVAHLSGGNQQKIVVGKNLSVTPKVLLLDEPTVGIDVKSKADILEEVRQLAADGNGIIIVSSELSELTALSDRVLVLHGGKVTRALSRANGDDISEGALSLAVQVG